MTVTDSGTSDGLQRSFLAAMVLLSMSLVTIRLLEAEPLRSANDRSRWCTVWSLVERNTYQIDEIRQRPGWDTIDMVRHEGHFYSSKPALLPRLVAELYRGLRLISGWKLETDTALVTRTLLLIVNILPMAWALWRFGLLILEHGTSIAGNLILISTACWGTLLTPFLTTFNNHTVAATFLLLAFCSAIRLTTQGSGPWWSYAWCGFTAAFACCNELPAAAFGVLLCLILWRQNAKATWLYFVTAALIPLVAHFLTNYHATGGWKPFYAYYGTEKYVYVFEGAPSYWVDPQGVDRAADSPLTYLLHCTIGHHGVLSLTPMFLLSLAGWLLACRGAFSQSNSARLLDRWQLVGLAVTVIVFGFYLSKTSHYNYGGVSVALRWMLWLIPFWLWALLPVLNRWGSRTWLQLCCGPLLAVSLYSAWFPIQAPWTQPWLFTWMQEWGWINYSSPRAQFPVVHRSWIGALPTEEVADQWSEFSCDDPQLGRRKLRIADLGPVDQAGIQWRHIELTEQPESRVTKLLIRPDLFLAATDTAGHPMKLSRCVQFDSTVPSAQRAATLRLLHGLPVLPATEEYRAARIRPVRTSLRRDAFLCHQGSVAVVHKDQNGTPWTYSREVWFCEEVPFGVLQFEDRTRDAAGQEVARRMWRLTSTSHLLPTSPVTVETLIAPANAAAQ